MNIQKAITELRTLQATLKKREHAAREVVQKLKARVATVVGICKPACIRAVQEYNRSAELGVVEESMQIAFSAAPATIDLYAHLRYNGGNEPDEDLTFSDVRDIECKLGQIIEREFKTENIPIAFNKLIIPTDYYGR